MIKIVDNGGNLPTLIMDEQNVVIRFFCSIIERGCLLYDHRYSEQRQEGAYMRSLSQPITRSIDCILFFGPKTKRLEHEETFERLNKIAGVRTEQENCRLVTEPL